MGLKSKKKAKTRLDTYYRLAKDQGYRARSAFKLIQLNRKYDFLGKSRVLVDLGAAPGGWCQVAAKHMPVGSKIVGVDLMAIQPIRGVKTFVGDITDDKTRKIIITWLKKEPVDIVIHDGAPNVGGVWSRDLFEQNALVLAALKTACSMLKLGGWFVTKVFRSQDFHKLMWVMKQLFEKCEATKPLASRMESAEIFVVCAGYKQPKTIDPKYFSAQEVFAEVKEERVLNAAGVPVIQKNNVPQGYDTDFATVLVKTATMTDFLQSDNPREFLKNNHEIRFPQEDRHYLSSKWSKKELVYLCHDLQQVGDADKRRLLRWREQLLREAKKLRAADDDQEIEADVSDLEGAGEDDSDVEVTEETDLTKLAKELLEVRKKKAKEVKKSQRKVVDRKLKQVRGLINHDSNEAAEHADDVGRGGGEHTEIEGEALAEDDWTIANVAAVDEDRLAEIMDRNYEEPVENHNTPFDHVTDVRIDKEDYDMGGEGEEAERLQVEEGNEDAYDVDAYGNYVLAEPSQRVRLFTQGAESKDDMVSENSDMDAEDFNEDDDEDDFDPDSKQQREEAEENDRTTSRWAKHHKNIDKILNQTFPKPKDPKRKRNERVEEELIEMHTEEPLRGLGREGEGLKKQRKKFEDTVSDDESDDDDSDNEDDYSDTDVSELSLHASDDDFEINQGRKDSRRKKAIVPDIGKLTAAEIVKQQRKQVLKDNKEKRGKKKSQKDAEGFEEIPVAMTDPDVRARTLAMATKMLSKKSRRDMMDAAINKYMHNDDDELPDWFIKDEQRNCLVQMPITMNEIEAQRQRFLELSSRPSKKVMEAMGRKRKKAQRMLRGMIEKGKTDPRAREKAAGTSIRKLMRSKSVKGDGGPKKKGPLDRKSMGQMRRQRQKAKKEGKKGGGKKR